MDMLSSQLDPIMEAASKSLAQMDYLACEDGCLRALSLARRQRKWPYYARILLPLQEARRQRRMIAADGSVRLGTEALAGEPAQWLAQMQTGCIALTRPHDAQTAVELIEAINQKRLCVEVLWVVAVSTEGAGQWTVRSYRGPEVECVVDAPPPDWTNRWITADDAVNSLPSDTPGDESGALNSKSPSKQGLKRRPVDWFLDACEALGNAALASVKSPLGSPERVEELEHCLDVVTDHEILHQALWDAAHALQVDAPT